MGQIKQVRFPWSILMFFHSVHVLYALLERYTEMGAAIQTDESID